MTDMTHDALVERVHDALRDMLPGGYLNDRRAARAALAAIRDAAGLDDDQMDYAIQEAGMLGGTRWRGEVGDKLAALLRALAGGSDAG